jgi:hypothetical protein
VGHVAMCGGVTHVHAPPNVVSVLHEVLVRPVAQAHQRQHLRRWNGVAEAVQRAQCCDRGHCVARGEHLGASSKPHATAASLWIECHDAVVKFCSKFGKSDVNNQPLSLVRE